MTGAGPGLMDAATKGALQAGKPVGGFKIGKEAGEWTASNFHPYLPSEVFSARKHGLVDAAVRSRSSDRTACCSTRWMLLGFLDDCEDWGTLSKGEITSLWKGDSNSEALAYLADFTTYLLLLTKPGMTMNSKRKWNIFLR
ncbi:hypothetical protein Pyn_20288 [Prunus yedoensis var. nudiflora]|uniref:Uncharacterized protein n=1 Tax=Prunus yedoensis var. nudiflora TaxID=2094558 RepID=A0A314YVK1_PRUYE|nr:hypothetical protein Pyn_20288 [Prunus yedoensis var. nudiflora]